ncbi:MAG: MBL fold metallo-hydrolase [Luteibaculum sp.]
MQQVDIQLIRNATLKISYAGKVILVDPMLGPKHSFMSFVEAGKNLNPTIDLKMSVEEVLDGIDAVLLTHPHMDHFDAEAKARLPKNLPVYIQPGDLEMLKNAGFENVNVVENKSSFEGISIYRTIGKHAHDEQMAKALGPVSGYVLKAAGYPSIYIVGDCVWDGDIEEQLNQHKPDIIVINSGAAVLNGKRILMDAEESIVLANASGEAKVIATHMEALDHCQLKRSVLESAAEDAGKVIFIPADGESVRF